MVRKLWQLCRVSGKEVPSCRNVCSQEVKVISSTGRKDDVGRDGREEEETHATGLKKKRTTINANVAQARITTDSHGRLMDTDEPRAVGHEYGGRRPFFSSS